MMTVVLSSSAGHTGVAGAFGVGGLLVPRVGFFGLLAVLVRSSGPANSFSVWVFLRHRYRSCWYPWLVVFCLILPCLPCSARFSLGPGLGSSGRVWFSDPTPFGERFCGGTGGILVMGNTPPFRSKPERRIFVLRGGGLRQPAQPW